MAERDPADPGTASVGDKEILHLPRSDLVATVEAAVERALSSRGTTSGGGELGRAGGGGGEGATAASAQAATFVARVYGGRE